MSVPQPAARVTLPSIQEMFPAELLGLPAHHAHRGLPPVSPPSHPAAIPAPPAGDGSPPGDRRPELEPHRRPSHSDEERRHACPTCGKAFNRPSSLKIHVNTHTGARPFECPFPGCGRRFNVNSNMRRHLRNHNPHADARPLNTASPYTYPLTTAPRALFPHAGAPACAPPPPAPPSPAHGRSDESGSEEDELSDAEYAEHDTTLVARVDRLRLRAYSASTAASSPRMLPAPAPRPRASSHVVPARSDGAPAAVLHPSSQVYRPTPGG